MTGTGGCHESCAHLSLGGEDGRETGASCPRSPSDNRGECWSMLSQSIPAPLPLGSCWASSCSETCSKHISSLGHVSSLSPHWMVRTKQKELWIEKAWKEPQLSDSSLIFRFFSPRRIWHGPSHLRGAHKNRNWNQATGSPFWNKERAQLSIPAPRLGLPNTSAAE